MFIDFGEGKVYKRAQCLCGTVRCTELVKEFKLLRDLRGNFTTYPLVKENGRQNLDNQRKLFWCQRARKKLALANSSIVSDHYDNRQKATTTVTRSSSTLQTQSKAYIALWHFDPILLDVNTSRGISSIKNNVYLLEKFASIDIMKSLKLYTVNMINYDKADECEGADGKMCVLPSYPESSVTEDLIQAKNFKRSLDHAEKVFQESYQLTQGRRRSSINYNEELNASLMTLHSSGKNSSSSSANTNGSNVSPALSSTTTNGSTVTPTHSASSRSINWEMYEADGCGLNRISISSDTFHNHTRNKGLAKQLFGFDSIRETKAMITALFDVEYEKVYDLQIKTGSGLTNMEQIMLTLVWTNLVLPHDILGIMFGCTCRQTVSNYINRWMPVLGERGDMMSNLLPFIDAEVIDALEPYTYKELDLRKIGAVVDGKDFPAETVRTDRFVNCGQHSNKVHSSAFRILTWSLPIGTVIERTPAFLARGSEKGIMAWWGLHGRLRIPLGYLILGDKGFDNTASCYVNYNTTLHPAFLTNDQFNLSQTGHNVQICQKRYTCEVVYSRVTNVKALYGTIPRERFHLFEPLVGWGHGRSYLCYEPLQSIDQ